MNNFSAKLGRAPAQESVLHHALSRQKCGILFVGLFEIWGSLLYCGVMTHPCIYLEGLFMKADESTVSQGRQIRLKEPIFTITVLIYHLGWK